MIRRPGRVRTSTPAALWWSCLVGALLLTASPPASAQDEGIGQGPTLSAYGERLAIGGRGAPRGGSARRRPAPPQPYGYGIAVRGPGSFQQRVRTALDRLQQTDTGRQLLDQLAATGRKVTIYRLREPNGVATPAHPTRGDLRRDGTPGPGTDSEVGFNPDFEPGGVPSLTILAHELMHALHFARGEALDPDRIDPKTGEEEEEWRTIGLGPYAGERVTENRLRRELNEQDTSQHLPPRTAHGDPGLPTRRAGSDPAQARGSQPSRPPARSERDATGAAGRLGRSFAEEE